MAKRAEDITLEDDKQESDDKPRQSMVARTIHRLVDLSLAAEDGGYLGSENDLIQKLEVSRPTLRQAAKVVESDRLLSVRRGVNGGFYAMRPDARHVVKAPALWLRLQSATLLQMNRASMLIYPEAAADAARCEDPALIEELRAFREGIEHRVTGNETQRETVRSEVYLARLIARMSGDPVLLLFTDISYSFGLLERDFTFYRSSIARRDAWLSNQKAYCDAILAHDPDVTRLLSRRRGKLINTWIQEDTARMEEESATKGA